MEHIYIRFEGGINIASSKSSHNEEKPAEWIEVLDWQHGSSKLQNASTTPSLNQNPESLCHNSIVFIKAIDIVSPLLQSAFNQKSIFNRAILEITRVDKNTHLEMILDQVAIASIAPCEKYKTLESEKITLRYQSIKWTYSIGRTSNKNCHAVLPELYKA